jgi:hypothetical protein
VRLEPGGRRLGVEHVALAAVPPAPVLLDEVSGVNRLKRRLGDIACAVCPEPWQARMIRA